MHLARMITVIALLVAFASTAAVSTSFACPNDESGASDSNDGE